MNGNKHRLKITLKQKSHLYGTHFNFFIHKHNPSKTTLKHKIETRKRRSFCVKSRQTESLVTFSYYSFSYVSNYRLENWHVDVNSRWNWNQLWHDRNFDSPRSSFSRIPLNKTMWCFNCRLKATIRNTWQLTMDWKVQEFNSIYFSISSRSVCSPISIRL